jgi:hypothetical protein
VGLLVWTSLAIRYFLALEHTEHKTERKQLDMTIIRRIAGRVLQRLHPSRKYKKIAVSYDNDGTDQ